MSIEAVSSISKHLVHFSSNKLWFLKPNKIFIYQFGIRMPNAINLWRFDNNLYEFIPNFLIYFIQPIKLQYNKNIQKTLTEKKRVNVK